MSRLTAMFRKASRAAGATAVFSLCMATAMVFQFAFAAIGLQIS